MLLSSLHPPYTSCQVLKWAHRLPKAIDLWEDQVNEGAWEPLQEARGSSRLGRSKIPQQLPAKVRARQIRIRNTAVTALAVGDETLVKETA
jgi:hypothetical protein